MLPVLPALLPFLDLSPQPSVQRNKPNIDSVKIKTTFPRQEIDPNYKYQCIQLRQLLLESEEQNKKLISEINVLKHTVALNNQGRVLDEEKAVEMFLETIEKLQRRVTELEDSREHVDLEQRSAWTATPQLLHQDESRNNNTNAKMSRNSSPDAKTLTIASHTAQSSRNSSHVAKTSANGSPDMKTGFPNDSEMNAPTKIFKSPKQTPWCEELADISIPRISNSDVEEDIFPEIDISMIGSLLGDDPSQLLYRPIRIFHSDSKEFTVDVLDDATRCSTPVAHVIDNGSVNDLFTKTTVSRQSEYSKNSRISSPFLPIVQVEGDDDESQKTTALFVCSGTDNDEVSQKQKVAVNSRTDDIGSQNTTKRSLFSESIHLYTQKTNIPSLYYKGSRTPTSLHQSKSPRITPVPSWTKPNNSRLPSKSPTKVQLEIERDALEEELVQRYTQLRLMEQHYQKQLKEKDEALVKLSAHSS